MKTIKKVLFDQSNLNKFAIEVANFDSRTHADNEADSRQASLLNESGSRNIHRNIIKIIRGHLFLIYLNAIELFYILNK
jgi:hypothetical protein